MHQASFVQVPFRIRVTLPTYEQIKRMRLAWLHPFPLSVLQIM
jgi:hypothetical protein